jgi:hypothetical protein
MLSLSANFLHRERPRMQEAALGGQYVVPGNTLKHLALTPKTDDTNL